MSFDGIAGVLMLVLFGAAVWKVFRRRGSVGPAAIGTMHGMLNEDKRRAIEIIAPVPRSWRVSRPRVSSSARG